ncbi:MULTISPECIES: hypothetical protein [Prescottella]|uniref:hypothetical protein n=1 Tax=Prescottella TaxID=2979332 RepID=UPI00111BDDC5|nr:hypothetical protein [Prescottella equi]
MSQQAVNQRTRPGVPAHQRRSLVNRDELNQLPTIRGRDAAVRYITEHLGVPMTPTRMRAAIERRELPVFKISGANHLAPRDLYDWILSLAQTSKAGAA